METGVAPIPFPRQDDLLPVLQAPVNAHQPPGWQRCQSASIVAIAAAEDHLANIGIPRAQARIMARAAIRTYLQQMALEPRSWSLTTAQDGVKDFLRVVAMAESTGDKGAAS